MVIVKLRFQNVFHPHQNDKPALLLVWTVGTVEIKLCFLTSLPFFCFFAYLCNFRSLGRGHMLWGKMAAAYKW